MDRSITSGFLAVVSTKLLLLALGLVTSPLLTRFLGEGSYGDYSFLLSVFAIYMIFVSSGVTEGVRKYLAEDRPERNWRAHVVGHYLRLSTVLGVVGAGALVLAARSGLVTRVVDGTQFRTYFYLLAGLVLAAQFRAYVRRTLMGFGLERYSESLKVFYRVTFVGAALALTYLGYGVPGALVAHIGGSALAALVGGILVFRQVSPRAVVRLPDRTFPRREMFFYNSYSVVLVFLIMSLFHVDVIMIRLLIDGPQTGFYKVALILAEFLWVVPMAMQTVLLHSTSAMWSSRDTDRINRITTRVTRYTMLFTTLLAIGIAALAPTAIPVIWPDSYLASVTPLYLLLPGAVGFAVARPILAVGQGKGELGILILATGVAAIVNAGLNWLLIGRYGIAGAAVATSVGYGSMFFLHVWSARRLGIEPLTDARVPRIALTAMLSAPVILYLARSVEDPMVSLAVVPVAGGTLYLALALLTGALGVVECLGVAEQFPLIGGWATRAKARVTAPRSTDAISLLQRVLFAAGIAFFLAGVVITASSAGAVAPGLPSIGNDDRGTPDGPAPETTAPGPETDASGTGAPDADATPTASSTDGRPTIGGGSTETLSAPGDPTSTPVGPETKSTASGDLTPDEAPTGGSGKSAGDSGDDSDDSSGSNADGPRNDDGDANDGGDPGSNAGDRTPTPTSGTRTTSTPTGTATPSFPTNGTETATPAQSPTGTTPSSTTETATPSSTETPTPSDGTTTSGTNSTSDGLFDVSLGVVVPRFPGGAVPLF